MLGEFLLYAVILVIPFIFYKWFTLNYDYFEKRKVEYMKPRASFRMSAGLFFNRYNAVDHAKLLYEAFPEKS